MLLSEGIATSATDLCGTVHFDDVALPCNQVKLCAFKYFRSVRRQLKSSTDVRSKTYIDFQLISLIFYQNVAKHHLAALHARCTPAPSKPYFLKAQPAEQRPPLLPEQRASHVRCVLPNTFSKVQGGTASWCRHAGDLMHDWMLKNTFKNADYDSVNQDFFCNSVLQGMIRSHCTHLTQMKTFDPGIDADKTDEHCLHQVMHALHLHDCNTLMGVLDVLVQNKQKMRTGPSLLKRRQSIFLSRK